MKLYLVVNADKYELPICIAGDVHELAKFLGVSSNSIYSMVSRGIKSSTGKRTGHKVIAVEVDED